MSLLGEAVNIEDVYRASAVLGASGAGSTFANADCKGIAIIVKVTAKSGTSPTLAVKLQAYDIASGDWVDVLGASTITFSDVGTTCLVVYPGIAVTANLAVSAICPKTWRLYYTIGGSATPTMTFSVGYTLIV